MLTNYVTSLIRTWVPILVGYALTWLGQHFHVVLSPNTSDQLVLVAGGALSAGYYAVVRALEHRFPRLGWLLGTPAKPDYAKLQADGSYLVTSVVDDTLGNFTSPDPLAVEGADPNTPGASTPPEHQPEHAAPTAVAPATTEG